MASVAAAPSTVTPPLLSALLAPYSSVPSLTVVNPVYPLVPLSVSVPVPIFVKPPVVTAAAPDIVRLFVVMSRVEVVPAVKVKARSVEASAPVYCSVPPPSTRFVAPLVAAPRFPFTPPLPIVATLSTPSLIVVTPVKVLTPLSVQVPVPIFVRFPAPLITPANELSVFAVPTDNVEFALLNVTVAVPLFVKDPNVAARVPVLKASFAVPVVPFPKMTAPAAALLTFIVNVTPLFTTIVSVAVGAPLIPDPVVMAFQFVFDEMTIAESLKSYVATAPEVRPNAVNLRVDWAY